MSVTLDWDWATRSGGNLSPKERRYLIGVLLREAPTALAGQLRYRFGKPGTGSSDLIGLPVPDSTLARRAEEFAQQALSAPLLAHSYRTYFFGKALAAHAGVTLDEEVSYLAALLHDLNLETPTPGRCFALTGAERTAELLAGWGADDGVVRKVAAAACGRAACRSQSGAPRADVPCQPLRAAPAGAPRALSGVGA